MRGVRRHIRSCTSTANQREYAPQYFQRTPRSPSAGGPSRMEMGTTCPHAPGTFARPGVVRQGWYLVESARKLPAGRVRAVAIGPRRLVLYRDLDGRSHVVADRCPHLGSDLALAHVTPAGLRCRFHGWCWDTDGSCAAAPGNASRPRRRLRQYRSAERWGFLWAWLGGEPAFDLPEVPAHLTRRIVLAPHCVRAHSDVIFANGFDLA